MSVETGEIETKVPARLDRLPWSRFHWLVIVGLGTVWVLDGLEVTMVGSVASRLTQGHSGISISTAQIGIAGSIYVVGACVGALFFGQLTDRFGRKKLFMITLGLYIAATVATAFSFAPWWFFLARFFTGTGIGGEYSSINSAIDELIPARVRGRVDLMINGSYWVGSAIGSAAALFFLDERIFPADLGWRLAFGVGAVFALLIMLVRRNVPESPRWLFIHGRQGEAERIVDGVESDIEEETGEKLPEPEETLKVRQRETIPFRTIARTAFKLYPRRAILGIALFVGQAFLYNGVTFNLGTLYTTFFKVSSGFVPVFIIVYAVANFAGPMSLGRLFDTVGRKIMITSTYVGSAIAAVVLAALFAGGVIHSPWFFEALIVITFFLASSGASAAYLTVSEVFPMETRALAIAFFYAVGTGLGGIIGPVLFGSLINSGNRGDVAIAFYIGAAVMALGGLAEILFGVNAEGRSLEDIATPLTATDAEGGSEADPNDHPANAKKSSDAADSDATEQPRDPQRDRQLRIAARERAQRQREASGLRRFRPGPGASHASPGMAVSWPVEAEVLDAQVQELVATLDEHGTTGRRELATLVHSRTWGPGAFSAALRLAISSGEVQVMGRGQYAAGENARTGSSR